MKESRILKRERDEGRREALLAVLRARFKEAAAPLAPRIEAENDTARLNQWVELAAALVALEREVPVRRHSQRVPGHEHGTRALLFPEPDE